MKHERWTCHLGEPRTVSGSRVDARELLGCEGCLRARRSNAAILPCSGPVAQNTCLSIPKDGGAVMDTKRLRANCRSFDTGWLTEIEELFERILDDLDDFNDRLGKLEERIEKVETSEVD